MAAARLSARGFAAGGAMPQALPRSPAAAKGFLLLGVSPSLPSFPQRPNQANNLLYQL